MNGGSGPGGGWTGYEPSPPIVYIDPDLQEFFPKPPNERSIGLSGGPDKDLGTEIEI